MRKLILLFFIFFYTSSYGLTIEWKPSLIKTINLKVIESNIVPIPRDTLPVGSGNIEDFDSYQIICYKDFGASQLFIKSNFSEENVEIIIFERIRGIVHSGTIDLHSNRETSIPTPWGQGVYTIIFKINNELILKGDFVIL
ncbi:MAG: hypothetical protein IKY67_14915 [Paludibacteraceae bacterium]|nr:hypothetical protein [Paludibacteraceae bacterium]